MYNGKLSIIVMALLLLSFSSGPAFAADGDKAKHNEEKVKAGTYGHTKEELEARAANVRKQQEQRVTPEQRKAAAEALKAERVKVYKAKQAVKHSPPADLNQQ